MRKLRIAQITNLQESVPPLNKHGLEQIVSYLTEELVRRGHEVTLFAPADSKTNAHLVPLWPTATSRDLNHHGISPETHTQWAVATAFSRHQEFDIIHDHTRFTSLFFANLVPTPVVSTIHHPISLELLAPSYPPQYHPYIRDGWLNFAKSVHTVVVSKFQAQNYPSPSTVIPNGISLRNWVAPSMEPGSYLAFLGYLTPDKGAAEAVEAALQTNIPLKIAGPLDNSEANQKYFHSRIAPHLGSQIEYLGPLSFDQKQVFLSNALATLLPIQWDEPFGLVAIESLASGTPVIAWNRAALPEIIEDGRSGFLVNSVSEMVEKISKLSQINRADCRKRVEENFTSEIMTTKYESLYQSLLK